MLMTDRETDARKKDCCLRSGSGESSAKKNNCEFHLWAQNLLLVPSGGGQQRLTTVVNFWYLYSNSPSTQNHFPHFLFQFWLQEIFDRGKILFFPLWMFLTKPTQFLRVMRLKRSKLNKIRKEIKFHLCRSAGGLDLDSMRIQTCPTGTISSKG